MTCEEIVRRLQKMESLENIAGMARFGIRPARVLGISTPVLRQMAREIGRSHGLARKLWRSGIHEARILASLIDEPARVTASQMDAWAGDFDSWAVCDTCCGSLFDRTPLAWDKALQWSGESREYVKRAGFALMACLALHDKKAPDERYDAFLEAISRECTDSRPLVRKAVNWALRQIGKRNLALNALAIETAHRISLDGPRQAHWVAADALRELTSRKVQERLKRR